MPADEDKYPVETDRRRFVKGVVGSAALAGTGTAGAAAINSATAPTGAGGGITIFRGVELLDGPAPRGMPQIPVELEPVDGEDDFYIKGAWPEVAEREEGGRTITVAETEDYGGSGVTYSSEWFQYCGIQTNEGVYPGSDQDNYFRYASSSKYQWQNEEVSGGDRMRLSHFDDYESWGNQFGQDGIGKPAAGTWRSQDLPPAETMPVEVIRSKRVEEMAGNNDWIAASTDRGVIAHLNKCTHFCCVPGFKTDNYQGAVNAADFIYCQCHQSIYDPFSIVEDSFVALPRPERED